MFFSTRDDSKFVTASEAILQGIAKDGGLFLPTAFHKVDVKSCLNLSYTQIAYKILRPYLDDYSNQEVKSAIEAAYGKSNFPQKVIGLKKIEGKTFLELFHGPTLTFKDMALSLLPHLMEIALKKRDKHRVHILTATSGDTGSAVLSAFGKRPGFEVSVLYPNGGISFVQERQMLSFSTSLSRPFALKDGNFDDCQTLVKKTMLEGKEKDAFSSANSINPFRLLPQIVYYYAAYVGLVNDGTIKEGEVIDVIVPTGNFGDVFAGYLAKKMGLPIGKLIVASNPNRILPDFLSSGEYDLRGRDLLKTSSPSMDILISSNLERLLYLASGSSEATKGWMEELKEKRIFKVDDATMKIIKSDFEAHYSVEEASLPSIVSLHKETGYLIDPHTATAYEASLSRGAERHTLIVSTASPLKFPDTICHAFKRDFKDQKEALSILENDFHIELPPQFRKALEDDTPRFLISGEDFHSKMLENKAYEIATPATSANMGPGFDVLGGALSINNVFSFRRSYKDSTKGFFTPNKKNLVLVAYKEFFKHFGLRYIPARISQVKLNIPYSRGLGSSSSAIIAGLLGANAICNEIIGKEKLLDLATSIEGHPDNVAPCLLGGVCESYVNNGKVEVTKHEISKSIKVLLYIPRQQVSTSKARGILPKQYDFDKVSYQKERIPLLLEALKEGDIEKIKDAIQDKIHVPYRSTLIADYEKVKTLCDAFGLPMTISGSGSTLLIIYKQGMKIKDFIEALGKEKMKYPYKLKKANFVK
ncbi:MAG: threonine synthase [Bacilli bacterium]|nr:threonine synthase [Bacilli bacterium]